jgi:membrane protein DedA with SNARE-associated domain
MKGFKLRLNRLTEFFVYSIFGALVLTAGVWLWAQSSLSPDNPVPSLMMKIHGAAAMAALILLGALLSHIRRGWTTKKNRLSGVTLLTVILFLILTGYGLYYAGDEQLRAFISRSHTWIGFDLVLLIPGHVLLGRALRRKKRSRPNRDRRGACLAGEAVVSKVEGEEGASSHCALASKGRDVST